MSDFTYWEVVACELIVASIVFPLAWYCSKLWNKKQNKPEVEHE